MKNNITSKNKKISLYSSILMREWQAHVAFCLLSPYGFGQKLQFSNAEDSSNWLYQSIPNWIIAHFSQSTCYSKWQFMEKAWKLHNLEKWWLALSATSWFVKIYQITAQRAKVIVPCTFKSSLGSFLRTDYSVEKLKDLHPKWFFLKKKNLY